MSENKRMTKEEAELWIKRLDGGNEEDLYRPGTDLRIMLRMIFYGLKMPCEVYKMTIQDALDIIDRFKPKLWYEPKGKIYNGLEFVLEEHIRKYNLSPSDKLIQVSDRAIRYKLSNLTKAYESNDYYRPELRDFYYARSVTLNDTHQSMRRNNSNY